MIVESQSLESRKQPIYAPQSQRGFNLIELLIAIVIGIFISLMIVQYMATSSRVFKRQGADSNLEQNASFAISYLSQFIRQAGTRDEYGSVIPFFIEDCDGLNHAPAMARVPHLLPLQPPPIQLQYRCILQMDLTAPGRQLLQVTNWSMFFILQPQLRTPT